MPTPTLPLFHSLLTALSIPLQPPELGCIPPSLLLLALESLLRTRLCLPPKMRLCQTPADEVGVVKCLLGVLGDDLLSLDLSAVDPARVVRGEPAEMEVVLMALVVVARRRGMTVSVSVGPRAPMAQTSKLSDEMTEEREGDNDRDRGHDLLDGDEDDSAPNHRDGQWDTRDGESTRSSGPGLPKPIEPDVTLSSPPPVSSTRPLQSPHDGDHELLYRYGHGHSDFDFDFDTGVQDHDYALSDARQFDRAQSQPAFDPFLSSAAASPRLLELKTPVFAEYVDNDHDGNINTTDSLSSNTSTSTSTSTSDSISFSESKSTAHEIPGERSTSKTVLDCILEEFGLDVG